MNFDYLLIHYIGEFGTYQTIYFILVSIPTIFPALHSLSWTFTGASIPYRCLIIGETDSAEYPFEPKYRGYGLWLRNDHHKNDTNNTSKHYTTKKIINACKRPFNYNITQEIELENPNLDNTEPCFDGYKWDTSEITTTAIKRWEFVCNRQLLKAFVQSVYYIGQFFGSFIFGVFGDKRIELGFSRILQLKFRDFVNGKPHRGIEYFRMNENVIYYLRATLIIQFGRKKTFFLAIAIEIVCGTAMAYIPWWPLFALFRFGLGFAHPGIFVTAVVIVVELVGPKYRILSSVATGVFFAVGEISLGTLAYFIRDYQMLQLVISLPALLFLTYWWIIPESSRWLISHNRLEEADQILKRIAKCNKRELPDDWYNIINRGESGSPVAKREPTFRDLFRTPNIRRRSIVSFICWPSVSMSYYGLAMNPNFMGGDRYLSFIMGGVLEIVAVVIILFTVNHIGRKLMVFCGFLFAAVCLFTTLALPMEQETARMILVIVGKMLLTAVYAILYVYTPELFPTVIRSTAMGSCSMIARLGGTTASYLSMWLVDISKESVAIIFGFSCVISALVSLALPETAGQHQLETLEQAEEFGKDQSILSFRTESKKSAKNKADEHNKDDSENDSKDEKSTEHEKTSPTRTISTT